MQKPINIYLDQNIWIELTKIRKNPKNYPELSTLFTLLKEKSDKDEIRVFISSIHVSEISKIIDPLKRKDLVETMIEICKNNTILPYGSIIEPEIKNIIYKKLKSNQIDLGRYVLGSGIAHLNGANGVLRYKDGRKMDPEKEKELLEKIDSKESLKMCLNSDELIEGTTKIRKEILESEELS